MNALRIHGGRRLTGEWRVHSAKNAVLPIMAASILTGEATRLEGCPGSCRNAETGTCSCSPTGTTAATGGTAGI